MISYKNRFHGLNALRYVYANGKTTRSSSLSLKSVINKHRKDYRLAVVVSKKISKSAVKRNRMRRRIFEITRSLNIIEPYDIVITVHSDVVATMPASELEAQVTKSLKDAGIIN